MFAKCGIFALCVKVHFTVQEKNVFHFRERSFLQCEKKMSSISVNVRFTVREKNVFHFRECSFLRCKKKMSPISVNARMEKGGGEFGRNYFSSVAVVKKLRSAGNNVKCTVKLLLLKYEGGNGDGIS